MKKTKLDIPRGQQSKSIRPQDWHPEERLAALQKSYGLIGENLNACAENKEYLSINWNSGKLISVVRGSYLKNLKFIPLKRKFIPWSVNCYAKTKP